MTTNSPAEILRSVRAYIRAPYTDFGGYPLVLIMSDCAFVCADCAKSEYREISVSTRNRDNDDWRAMGVYPYWEGPAESCAHCGCDIESAYGDSSVDNA